MLLVTMMLMMIVMKLMYEGKGGPDDGCADEAGVEGCIDHKC